MRGNFWLAASGLFGATAVGIGAYHAHGLPVALERLALGPGEIERRLGFVETAYRYQMIHALAVLGVAVWLRTSPSSTWGKLAGCAFVVGIVLFSGSLYGLAATNSSVFAQVAPIGGFTLIGGWLLVSIAGVRTGDPDWTPRAGD